MGVNTITLTQRRPLHLAAPANREVTAAAADGVAIDATGLNARSPATFERLVDAHHNRPLIESRQ
jgi:hypothetical protein